MTKSIEQGDKITASMDGDVVEVAYNDVSWRIRVAFKEDAVILSDPDTGQPLYQGKISDIGITRTATGYEWDDPEFQKMLMGFVVAWVMLEPRH